MNVPLLGLTFIKEKGSLFNGKLQKFIVIGTKFGIRVLTNSPIWFLDGTFKMSPRNYMQVYIWLSRRDVNNISCLYIIMNSKSEAIYNACFSYVKNFFKNLSSQH